MKRAAAHAVPVGVVDLFEIVHIEEELVWTAIIEIANAVGKTFPGCYISVSGYGPLGAPPVQRIPANIFVGPTATTGPYSEFRADMMEEELNIFLEEVIPLFAECL